ncbi:cyclin-dependent kinase 7 [Coccinella septempunctata]|uniref:cyclin-dependent kinase 7 n=1 Tax=Coccinella septempunctata TaxID=41139 RepID=UPI001D06EF02|nr:cyclin-dependent kinase 7 [Coccinella septempunctata]
MYNRRKKYDKIKFLGEGQFATVFKAKNLQTGSIVAVKKIKIGSKQEVQDGVNRTALREIKLLQELDHPNLMCLLDVFGHLSNISLVFDFMDTDLEVIIKDTTLILTTANIKSYIIQTLQGLEYLHMNWMLHRDLKPNNLLVNAEGVLKIGDFGLAKLFGSPSRLLTHQVVTRWYRAPELLFGAKQYGTGVDMWAVGCILGELLLRVPLFPGESDLDQLTKIFTVFGNPTEENWPGMKSLIDYIEFKPFTPIPMKNIFTAAGDDLLDVLENILVLNPLKRKNCTQCLQMPFFSNKPAPTPGLKLPLPQKIKNTVETENNQNVLKRKLAYDGSVGPTLAKRLFF